MKIINEIDSLRIPLRESLNPVLGPIRLKKLERPIFTLISNNCWGGHVYRYFNLPYLSPTIGLYFFADDYVRFVSDLRHYCSCEPQMILAKDSTHYAKLKMLGQLNVPIGVLDNDVEIVFLHNHSTEEAKEKWLRRCERINWGNIVIKFSEQNGATPEHLKKVDNLTYDRKLIFTSHDYGLNSQVLFKEWEGYPQIPDESTHFRRYVNLINLINGKPFKKNQ